jgi:hypothetical protein
MFGFGFGRKRSLNKNDKTSFIDEGFGPQDPESVAVFETLQSLYKENC